METTPATSVGKGGYENPWIYQGTTFTSDDIDNFFGFVYCLQITRTEGSTSVVNISGSLELQGEKSVK